MAATSNGTPRFTGTTARALIREGAAALKASAENYSYRSGYNAIAEELLTFAAGEELSPSDAVDGRTRLKFQRAIARRAAGEPIPYITGETEFDGLMLTVKRGAFVPRWTTQTMAEEAAKRLRRRPKPVHVDLATGIGPVALSVANRVKHAKVHACDLSAKATALAKLNAEKLKLRNVSVHRGDLFKALPTSLRGKVDVVTIHPPYVASHEVAELPPELRDFEPKMSLTDRSGDGLALLERTARESEEWLRDSGWLIVEIGNYLAKTASAVIAENGFRKIDSVPSAMRLSRVIRAQR